MAIMLTQMGLNIFGSVDILPFTGVTFPFISRGGSSLISCWMMMAFLKSADNRRGASFAVRPMKDGDDGFDGYGDTNDYSFRDLNGYGGDAPQTEDSYEEN